MKIHTQNKQQRSDEKKTLCEPTKTHKTKTKHIKNINTNTINNTMYERENH